MSKTAHVAPQHMQSRPLRRSDWALRVQNVATYLIGGLARHWLLLVNTLTGLYAALLALPAALMVAGHSRAATLMYRAFGPLCHQLPERSFFLFGSRLVYTLEELERLTGGSVPLRFIGSTTVGYKMAICQRDVAIHLSIWLAGLVFAIVRQKLRPLPLLTFGVLCIPMALDGLGQLLGLWQSPWWTRVLSGGLFGVACVWVSYPHIEAGMRDVTSTIEA